MPPAGPWRKIFERKYLVETSGAPLTPSQEAFSLDLNCDSFWDLCWAKITEHKFSYAKDNLRIKALELQIGQVFEILYISLRANIKRRNLDHLIAHFCSSSREYFVGGDI